MKISINEQPADIILESEKTVGELLSGLEEWLQGSGNRISGLQINGQTVNLLSFTEAFERSLESIESIDIKVSTLPELALEALFNAQDIVKVYGDSSFEEQNHIKHNWEESAAAHFLSEQIADIALSMHKTFLGEYTCEEMGLLINERIRELMDPEREFGNLSALISGIAARLEDLPLDIQTGKDIRVAETVQLFSHTTEKLFRLLQLLKLQGFAIESIFIDTVSADTFIEEFSATIKELLAAYEIQDAVLVGDLAEYELSPRLLKLYSALRDGLS
jgi:hypothetical protein